MSSNYSIHSQRLVVVALVCCSFAISPMAFGETLSDAERLERLERAVELLQKRNTELEAELKNLKKEKASPPKDLTSEKRSHFVPDSKSYVAEKSEVSEEKKPIYVIPGASEIKLVLGGFIQMQYEAGDVFAFEGRFGSAAIDDRFRLRRARINLSGDFAEHFDFKIEGEFEQSDVGLTIRDATGRTLGSNSTRTAFGATDIFINWHQFPEFQIKAGQYKAPFGLEQITSDTKLFLTERSEVTSALTPERQVGVEIWGKPFTNVWPEQKDFVTYWAGIFNGNGRNVSINDNDDYMYAGRIEVQALKAKIFNDDATVRFGANALSSRDASGTVLSPAGTLRVNSDGSLSTFTASTAAKREGYGFDGTFHWDRFDLIGEFLSESYDSRVTPGFRKFRADGYYVQASYFVIPEKLQFVAKYETFSPGQVANDDISSLWGGVNYYVHGDDVKLMANYVHTWSDFRESNPGLGTSDFDEVILRLQVVF
jgi:phosphate-selective porin OprO and OprP